jgi:hypothetical protein
VRDDRAISVRKAHESQHREHLQRNAFQER